MIKFPTPQAPFWNRITIPGTVVLPVEVQETEGLLITSGNPVPGTGPFIHDEYAADSIQREVRNPNYFKPGLPYLDAVEGAFLENLDARFVAFRAKQIDYVDRLTPQYTEEAQGMDGVTVDSRIGVCCPQWIQFNLTRPAVRRRARPQGGLAGDPARGDQRGRIPGQGRSDRADGPELLRPRDGYVFAG